MLKVIISFLFIILNYIICLSQDCSMLPDGRYEVKYDEMFEIYGNYQFEIAGNNFIRIDDKKRINQTIEKHSECRFSLKSKDTINKNDFSELEKMLSTGTPFYDITKVDNNTYYFTLRIDLHLAICSGTFLKI